jgi:thermitase
MTARQLKSGLLMIAILAGITAIVLRTSETKNYPRHDYFAGDHQSRGPASSVKAKRVRPQTVLFKIKDDRTQSEKLAFAAAAQKFGVRIERKIVNGKINFAKAEKLEGLTEQDIANALVETGGVEFAEPDRFVELGFAPNDSELKLQWHHSRINSFDAWNTTQGSTSVVVANCDTGVESTHRDLKRQLLLPGYNSVDGSSNSEPIHPHGTMTAGTTAATLNNRIGVAGVSGGVRLLPIRVSNDTSGGAYFSSLAGCVEYAADRGAKVVNLSYGGADSYTIDSSAQYLRAKGGLLIMSAGNSGVDNSSNPDFTSFVIVGATDSLDARAPWSNYGLPTDLVAPGVDIFTTYVGDTYANGSGTSFSAPIVSGAAALIYSINPSFTPDQVEQILFSSATTLGTGTDDLEYGHGRINVAEAVRLAALAITAPSPTPTPRPKKGRH